MLSYLRVPFHLKQSNTKYFARSYWQEEDPKKRQVAAAQGRHLAELYGANYIETSAKNGTGVDEAFKTFVR